MISAYKFRSAFIFLIFVVIYTVLVIHLYCIQIRQHDFYKNLGEQQYSLHISVPWKRGAILDRHGAYLALNKEAVSAFLLPKKLKNPKKLISFLAEHFPKAAARLKNSGKQFMYIKRALTDDEVKLIEEADLPDIKLLNEPNRYYPIEAASQLVGLTDIDNKGQFGVEHLCEKKLAGEAKKVALQKDARSGKFYFNKETEDEGVAGVPVQLTIDADIQFLAFEAVKDAVTRFGAESGGAIVMNPLTGEILAMVNYPSFDPNDTRNLVMAHTKNNCITDVHEPGSVVKSLVALALFEEELIDPEELIDCENKRETKIDGIPVPTVTPHGVLSFSEVIQKSNNIGVVKAARRLGPLLYDHYCRVGFGKKSGLNWLGEQSGFVNNPKRWSGYSLRSLAFGYELTASVLHIARAFSIIANGGYWVDPQLVMQDDMRHGDRIYSQDAVEKMQDILEKTVRSGTAFRARMNGYRVMGKTGTTNKWVDGTYDASQNVYLFAGNIQNGDYNRVIVTFVNNAHKKRLYASQVAAPLFEKIAQTLVIHDRVVR